MRIFFRKFNNQGFTIMELMIVVAIVGIMAAVAIPNMIGQKPRRNLKDAGMALISTMQRAKMEAIQNNVSIGIGFTATGYTVYRDYNGNGTQDNGERRWMNTMPPGCVLANGNFPGNTTGYNSRGLPLNNSGHVDIVSTAGTFQLTMTNSGYARLIDCNVDACI